jgi:acyl-CoA thioesterase FadM
MREIFMARATLDLPEVYVFSTQLTVRINEINYGGHLGNDSILAMIHEARLRLLNHYQYSEKNVEGCGIIMADAIIIFKSQAYYGDILIIEIAFLDFSKHACDIIYRITNQKTGKEVARAKTRIAFFDYEKNRTVKVPEKFRSLFDKP